MMFSHHLYPEKSGVQLGYRCAPASPADARSNQPLRPSARTNAPAQLLLRPVTRNPPTARPVFVTMTLSRPSPLPRHEQPPAPPPRRAALTGGMIALIAPGAVRTAQDQEPGCACDAAG